MQPKNDEKMHDGNSINAAKTVILTTARGIGKCLKKTRQNNDFTNKGFFLVNMGSNVLFNEHFAYFSANINAGNFPKYLRLVQRDPAVQNKKRSNRSVLWTKEGGGAYIKASKYDLVGNFFVKYK